MEYGISILGNLNQEQRNGCGLSNGDRKSSATYVKSEKYVRTQVRVRCAIVAKIKD